MLLREIDDPLFGEVNQLVISLGYQLVDFAIRKKDGVAKVALILWGPAGIGVDDCAKVHRVVLPRMEIQLAPDEVVMEVSSPGLDRNIRYVAEFRIFLGKKVKILQVGQSEWNKGKILGMDDKNLELDSGTGSLSVPLDKISKAKLDDI